MKESGKLTIGNTRSTQTPNGWISIEIRGEKMILRAEVSLEDFSRAITGSGRVDCEFMLGLTK